MSSQISESIKAPLSSAGKRFDQVAVELFPDYSRSRIQNWIKSGCLVIDGRKVKPNTKLAGGEHLQLNAEIQVEGEWEAQDIPLDIVFEDEHILVINKPDDFVVHPAAGNWDGTVLNALLFHCPELIRVPRAGIVHRLDKDTTGLMVVAKTIEAQTNLVNQLQERTVKRQYKAVVKGLVSRPGTVDADIGRHPTQRTKMAVVKNGKPAKTHYETERQFKAFPGVEGFSLVTLKLETGRTHQIRVHMSHLGFHSWDAVYGKSYSKQQLAVNPELEMVDDFGRQALHAKKLGLIHPASGDYCEWTCPMPDDMFALIDYLEDEFS